MRKTKFRIQIALAYYVLMLMVFSAALTVSVYYALERENIDYLTIYGELLDSQAFSILHENQISLVLIYIISQIIGNCIKYIDIDF